MKVCCIIFWFFDSFNLIQSLDKEINLNMDLSVVVPVYNSEKIINDLVKKINDSKCEEFDEILKKNYSIC